MTLLAWRSLLQLSSTFPSFRYYPFFPLRWMNWNSSSTFLRAVPGCTVFSSPCVQRLFDRGLPIVFRVNDQSVSGFSWISVPSLPLARQGLSLFATRHFIVFLRSLALYSPPVPLPLLPLRDAILRCPSSCHPSNVGREHFFPVSPEDFFSTFESPLAFKRLPDTWPAPPEALHPLSFISGDLQWGGEEHGFCF